MAYLCPPYTVLSASQLRDFIFLEKSFYSSYVHYIYMYSTHTDYTQQGVHTHVVTLDSKHNNEILY